MVTSTGRCDSWTIHLPYILGTLDDQHRERKVMAKKKEPFMFQVGVQATVADKEGQSTSTKLLLKLGSILSEHSKFNRAHISVSPLNVDYGMPDMLETALAQMQELIETLYARLRDDSNDLAVYYTDLCALRDATKRMQRTTEDIKAGNLASLNDKAKDGVMAVLKEKEPAGVQVITPDRLHVMPQEALHFLAHIIAEQKHKDFDCKGHTLTKDELIVWIKKEAFGLDGKFN